MEVESNRDQEKCISHLAENEIESAVECFGTNPYKITSFSSDKPMSTYLFAIICGPYHVVEKMAEFEGKSEPLRMRFMSRDSLKANANKTYDHVYEAIVTGIKWYEQFFGYEYPWDKYDQIFCPEFKYGAMENVGAVTFSENYLSNDDFTETHLTSLQNTVLHEL